MAGATSVVTHNATHAVTCRDTGVGKRDVLHNGSTAEMAEQSAIVVVMFIVCLIETDAADGVSGAVKMAIEGT